MPSDRDWVSPLYERGSTIVALGVDDMRGVVEEYRHSNEQRKNMDDTSRRRWRQISGVGSSGYNGSSNGGDDRAHDRGGAD